MSIFSVAGSTPSEGFELKSIRFNEGSSGGKLTFTPSVAATDGRILTYSFWFKGKQDSAGLNANKDFEFLTANVSDWDSIGLGRHNGKLNWYFQGGNYGKLETTAVYQDPSAWYHVVCRWNTTLATAGDRMKMYVNGEEVTSFSTDTNPSQNYVALNWNAINVPQKIANSQDGSYPASCYMAEAYMLDGRDVGPEYFGETNALTNQWQPKEPKDIKQAVTFGTNGWYLPFSNDALADSFEDSADKSATPTTVTTSTTEKKFGTASALCLHNNSYLQVPRSPDWTFAGPFTIELWVRITDTATDTTLFDHWLGSGNNRVFQITYSATQSGRHRFQWSPNGTSAAQVNVDYTSVLAADTWYHLAWCRDAADDLRFFVNGTQVGSTATTVTGAAYNGDVDLTINIGGNDGSNISNYMDEIRISNTARYTSNFAVATSAFTTDANTKLLLHCDGANSGTSFPDSSESANRHLITDYNDVTNERISNKAVGVGGNAHIIGPKVGSSAIAFPGYSGANGYLTIPDSSDWDINATSDWTWEFWLYRTTTDASGDALINHADGGGNGWNMNWDGSNKIRIYNALNGTGGITATNIIPENKWTHFAMVHDDSADTLKIYLDGVEDAFNNSFLGYYLG